MLQQKAAEVFNELNKDDELKQKIDPELIAVIAEIILELIKMIQSCRKTPQQAIEISKNPSIAFKVLARIKVRRKTNVNPVKIVDSVFKVSGNMNLEEMNQLYTEV